MSAEFPNEPVGATNFHNWGHNLLTGGGWYDAYGGFSTSIVSDATAPLSPNNVLQQRFPSGGVGGNTGGGGNLYTFPTFYPQGVFYAFWMKLDANFEHHPSGTKVAWIHTRNGNSPQNNNLICMVKSSGGSLAHPMISWQWANGQPDNSHLGFVGSGYIESGTTFSHNAWTKFEWIFKPSTNMTSQDGVYKLYINNSLACSTTSLNTPAIYPDSVSHITVWGGTGGTKTRDSYIWWDHEYVSALSGGTTPPATPPAISSITPTSGPVGTPITVVGTNFDQDINGNTVTLNGTACQVLAATTTQLNTAVPNTGTTGNIVVVTDAGSATSPVPFTVTQPNPGGGTGGGTGGGAGATTYTYTTDFSGTQGPRWYYLNEDGSQMTYSNGIWSGNQLYKGIWNGGFHPGSGTPAVLKYVVPGTGSVRITGDFLDLDAGGGNGVVCTIKKNGSTLSGGGPFTIANGNTTGTSYDITNSVTDGDYFTFEVSSASDNSFDSTNLNPVVVYTPQPQTVETITLTLTTLTAEEQTTQSITLTIAPTRATESIVTLSSSLVSTATVPETVTIPANTSSALVAVVLGIPGTSTITATLGTSTTTTTVTSTAAPDPEEPVPVSPTLSAYTDFLVTYRWF